MKKLLALLLIVSMMVVAAGCGQKAETGKTSEKKTPVSSETTSAAQSSETKEEQKEEVKEPDKVTMLVAERYVADYNTNLLSKAIMEAANVEIEFIVIPRDEIATKLSLMVNGGSDLPDMICTTSFPSSYDYGMIAGVYMPLQDFFNDPEKTPNFNNNVLDKDKELMLGSVVQPDGNVYTATWYFPGVPQPNATCAYINQDWLDAVGMDVPKTTEEFYQVLKAFKEKDPNGNGKADEIPAISSNQGEYGIAYSLSPFVYINKTAVEYVNVDENGKVYSAFTTPEWKQGIEYLNKLVTEELLVSVSFTQDNAEFNAIIQSQPVGVYFSTIYDNNPEEMSNYVPLPTLTGPNGANYVSVVGSKPAETFAIFSDTENVDACVRVMDAFYDRDISALARRGEEGVDWTTDVPEGYAMKYDVEGVDKPGFTILVPQWGVKQNTKMWMNYCPGYLAANDPISDNCEGVPIDESATDFATISVIQSAALVKTQMESGEYLENQLVRVLLDADAQTEFVDLNTAIGTYVDEAIVRFATGDMAISEWDNYIKTLEGMGLARFIELIQLGYDNYNNALK